LKSKFAQNFFAIFELDLRSLAAFRIAFGVVVLYDLIIRFQDLHFFYSNDGVLPSWAYTAVSGPWDVSLYLANGSWQWAAALLSISIVVCLSFILGYRTREATILLAVLVLSLQRRNNLVLLGSDAVIRCMLFWSMFLPLGRRWSLDAKKLAKLPDNLQICSVSSMCVVMQIAMLYFFAGLMKTHEIWRVDGTALQYALNVDQFTNSRGRYLLQYPEFLKVISFAVLALENYVILLLLAPWFRQTIRMILIVLYFALHLGIAVLMELGAFPYVCMALWLVFLPPTFWDVVLKRFKVKMQPSSIESSQNKKIKSKQALGEKIFWHKMPWGVLQSLILAFLIINALLWNVRNLDLANTERVYPAKYNFILALVGLDQNWGMFSPYPINWDGWFLISAKTTSGRTVNLTPGAMPNDAISEKRPKEIWRMYQNEHQLKYYMSLASHASLNWRPYYVRAVALQWARNNPQDPLTELDIFFFQELTMPDGSSTPPEKFVIWHSENPGIGA
jgi:hypothetical protein